ncbi:MAG TPA: lysophospholipid acyltransferase family protein [Terriglobales bacterium]|nr:lysophospholipid acyltransferase family protein [Terriglobales bacterium]
MRILLTLAFWIVATPIGALIAFPWTLMTGNSGFLYRVGIWIVRGGMRLSGVRAQIVGRERLDPSTSYVFMANHVSNLDPPLLVPAIPRRTSVLVKRELFRIPVLGRAMRLAQLVAVDRSNREAAIASVRAAAEVLRRGLNMTVFPEGTRSPDGRLLPLKKGPFYLAQEAGAPIVPVTILGTEQIWPKGKLFLRRGQATIIFHPPISPPDYPDQRDLIAAVRDAIASGLPPERR